MTKKEIKAVITELSLLNEQIETMIEQERKSIEKQNGINFDYLQGKIVAFNVMQMGLLLKIDHFENLLDNVPDITDCQEMSIAEFKKEGE